MVNSLRPQQIPLSELKGSPIAKGADKIGSTPSHTVHFSDDYFGESVPRMRFTPRIIVDPEESTFEKLFDIKAEEASSITSADAFKEKLASIFAEKKDFLIPERTPLFEKLQKEDKTNFAYNSISSSRINRFFDEAKEWIKSNSLGNKEDAVCRRAINRTFQKAFRDRTVKFDRANTDTYWSFSHDSMYVHVFEKMLQTLPENDPKRNYIQKQIDYIYTHEYTYNGKVDETDIENKYNSLNLRAIDAATRHTVSMTPKSEKSSSVRYYILQIPKSYAKNGGRFAYRDGEDYFFEDTHEPLSKSDIRHLRERYAHSIVLRPLKTGEKPRPNFRFDWSQSGVINAKPIDTSWWGKCDIKTKMQKYLFDLKGSAGVKEFNSETQKTTLYTRRDLLEASAAILDSASSYQAAYPTSEDEISLLDLSQSKSGGFRFDAEPDRIEIETDKWALKLTGNINKLSKPNEYDTEDDTSRVFQPLLPDKKLETFEENQEILRNENNTYFIDGLKRKLSGTIKGYTFDKSGHYVELKEKFEIDPSKDEGEPVLIGSSLVNLEFRRIMRQYYDPKTKEIIEVQTAFKYDREKGEFIAKEGKKESLGKIASLTLGRQLKTDHDGINKQNLPTTSMQTGLKIGVDSDPTEAVWNGDTYNLRVDTDYESPDGTWERVSLRSDATFGFKKISSFVNKLDSDGNIEQSCETKAGVGFYWDEVLDVGPLISHEGVPFANQGMIERGILDLGSGKAASIGALQDLYDLVYLGFLSKESLPTYTILHNGQKLVYEKLADWQADVDLLKSEAAD